ncbi:glutathione S-transferase 1: isoform D-like protein, partial [Dinothrombium tinctorium]
EEVNGPFAKMVIKLYYMPISGPCRAVLLTARYLNIHLELIEVNLLKREQIKQDFIRINPQHCVPTIDDDGFILWECRAIMQYFVNKYRAGHSVYPEEPHLRANVDRLLYFDIGTIVAAQVEVTASQIVFGVTPDQSKLDNLKDKLRILDGILAENDFVAGSTLTLPDISIAAYITTLAAVNFDIYKFENISRWIKRLKSTLPDFSEINEKNVTRYKQMIENGEFRKVYNPLYQYYKSKR